MSDYQPPPPAQDNGFPAFGAPDAPAYPGHPGSYAAAEPAAPAPRRPRSIEIAVRLMWAGAVLSGVSLIVTLVTLGSLKDHVRQGLRDNHTSYTAHDFDTLFHTVVILAVIEALIAIGLWLWMAWKNGAGRRWARTVSTLLGGLSLVLSLYAIVSGTTIAASLILTLLNLLLAIAILAFLWRGESSEFYRATARHRAELGG